MTGTFTHVGLVVDALVALSTNVLPELAVNNGILDGPPTTDVPNDYIAVGFNPGTVARPQVAAIKGSQTLSQYIPGGSVEQFDVFCQISAFDGDTSMSVTRNRAMAYFNEFSTGLDADRSLGGTVPLPGKAQINDMQWFLEQGQDFDGTVATVIFTVQCRIEFM